MRGEGGHGGDGGSGRESGSGPSGTVSGNILSSSLVSSNGLVGTESNDSAMVGEAGVTSTIGEWIRSPPPTLTSKRFSGGSQFTVITLATPERFEYERENPRKVFGVVWAVDMLRASERRADIAEGEFLGVTSLSFLNS